jgi:hypothetical protein
MAAKFFTISLLVLLLISCNERSSVNSKNTDTAKIEVNTSNKSVAGNDTSLLSLTDTILNLLKNRDYNHLAQFIHPQLGVRFSPYGIVDTAKNIKLSAQQLVELSNNKKTIKWGTFEGSGEPINLNIDDYFKKVVYDVDFINAEKKSVNKIIGADSTASNIASIYPGCDFVQFYFSGFKKQYQGMDWKSLVLVYKRTDTKPFLVAIVHNQFKI